jgi:hypothetical protein
MAATAAKSSSLPRPLRKGLLASVEGHAMTTTIFMFATGIENSYPTINGGRTRVDEMEKCGHYEHWRTDFDLLNDLNIHYLRYGPPIHQT